MKKNFYSAAPLVREGFIDLTFSLVSSIDDYLFLLFLLYLLMLLHNQATGELWGAKYIKPDLNAHFLSPRVFITFKNKNYFKKTWFVIKNK